MTIAEDYASVSSSFRSLIRAFNSAAIHIDSSAKQPAAFSRSSLYIFSLVICFLNRACPACADPPRWQSALEPANSPLFALYAVIPNDRGPVFCGLLQSCLELGRGVRGRLTTKFCYDLNDLGRARDARNLPV